MYKRSGRKRLRDQSINRLIPNMLTVLALCAGLTSIRFALDQRWEMAVFAIVVAAVLDGLDGRIARLLDSTSKFGAERSEERRVGKECVSTCRSRGSPVH